MSKKPQKHEFALFYPELKVADKAFTIHDSEFVKRIGSVLRLRQGGEIILFSRDVHASVRLDAIDKKAVKVTVLSSGKNKKLIPFLTVILPVLKREALETALYACAELGVNEVYLVSTQKSLQVQKDEKRYQRIIIAAAEQSKNFSFPLVYGVRPLHEVFSLLEKSAVKLFADPSGSSLRTVIEKPEDMYVLMVGPEGDLTQDEKIVLQKEGFIFCHLTPTILRSPQALSVMVGCLRALI